MTEINLKVNQDKIDDLVKSITEKLYKSPYEYLDNLIKKINEDYGIAQEESLSACAYMGKHGYSISIEWINDYKVNPYTPIQNNFSELVDFKPRINLRYNNSIITEDYFKNEYLMFIEIERQGK